MLTAMLDKRERRGNLWCRMFLSRLLGLLGMHYCALSSASLTASKESLPTSRFGITNAVAGVL